jgi:CHASE2 domain-containing sensor protein
MTAHRILQLNAAATAACGARMLAARGVLPPLFSLESPVLFDILAIGLLAYAAALAVAASRRPVSRPVLMAFTVADAAWVVGSAILLLLFWGNLAPIARILVAVVAAAVELFALLQFRAAREAGTPAMA